MRKSRPSPTLHAVPVPPAAASVHAQGRVSPVASVAHAEPLTALVDRLLTETDRTAAQAPTPLLQAVDRIAADPGPAAVETLLDVVDHLSHRAQTLDDESPKRRLVDALEQHGGFAVIKALQRTAAARPEALAAAYGPGRSVPALDVLCEAASSAAIRHPALLSLQVQHLTCNASVAALSLANYGDPSGRDAIVAQLKIELSRWQGERPDQTASFDMGTLHIEGMLEALESFQPPLAPALRKTAEAVVSKTRGKMGALHALLHEGQQLGH